MTYTGWVGSALVFLGLWLTGRKNKYGFIVGAVAELFWLLYSIHINSPELGIMAVVFIIIYLWNFYKWSAS